MRELPYHLQHKPVFTNEVIHEFVAGSQKSAERFGLRRQNRWIIAMKLCMVQLADPLA